ncbi:MAG: leucine-rich repeat domain-containing protein, partial [Prevotella sp.]|nr:leucine-rich repeat domain-containing protein [Prevotella sp.]
MKRALLFILVFLPMLANADAVEISGIYYNLDSEAKTAEVTSNPNIYMGDITIPESVEYEGITYGVTSIGAYAFAGCTKLASVTIPNTVATISVSAFRQCSSLISIVIPDSVTFIGGHTFHTCTSLTSVTIGSGVTSIGRLAFAYCKSLTSITIPNSVTTIDYSAFQSCTSLTSVTIGSGVTSIGTGVFRGCDAITSVTSLIENPFAIDGKDKDYPTFSLGTYDNASLYVPRGMVDKYNETEGWKDFANIKEIEEETLEIDNIFYTLNYPKKVAAVTSSRTKYAGEIVIPESVVYNDVTYKVTAIDQLAFDSCEGLTSVTLPNTITTIGFGAFHGCSHLTSINIPEGTMDIGDGAFNGCQSLTSITIPNSVVELGEAVFNGCTNLESVKMSENVTSIDAESFFGCTNLASIEIPNGVKEIGNWAFRSCENLTSVTIPETVESIGEYAFSGCNGLTSIIIPDKVVYMGQEALSECENLHAVSIGKGLRTIPERAFTNCENLESVVFSEGLTTIDTEAFRNCKSIAAIELPNSLTTINQRAFQECANIKTLSIPSGLTTIDISAFRWCPLESITVDKENTVFDSRGDCNAIIRTSNDELFLGCKNTVIPDDVKHIGVGAFFNIEDLTSITIPQSVTTIEATAFDGCKGLTSITIPDNVTYIGIRAFAECMGLTSVVIPNQVRNIDAYAFNGCPLTSITLGSGVKNIGRLAFYSPTEQLTDVYCYAKTVPTARNSFDMSLSQTTLHVPAVSLYAYQTIEPWKNFKEFVALPGSDMGGNCDYIPFVEKYKQWNVVISYDSPYYGGSLSTFSMEDEVERDGKSYTHASRYLHAECEVQETGLFREENRRVYKYDEKTGRDIMLYDFSLKEGDTFTYEFGVDQPVNCKVLKQGLLEDGPQIASSCTLTPDGTLDIKYRWLNTWTIGRENESGEYEEFATWVEGIGALENVFGLISNSIRKFSYDLAYVKRIDYEIGYRQNEYLPFSFNRILMHGCDLPTSESNEEYDDRLHHLTYELEGDRLHIYGDVYIQCGPNNYAYFYERPTDDPSVHMIEFQPWEVYPVADCMDHHATDFYVPGFDPNLNYYVLDNKGEKHPVINKMAYRPMIEDGKVWVVKVISDGSPTEEWIEYYYFDGDTIVDGQAAKRMLCDRTASRQDTNGEYVGAWYEQDKKVYFAGNGKQQFELLYDFT